jgi:hypothetical protein
MSRSGYSDDCDGWALIRWRGAVASAIRGERGQSFLRDLVAALDAMPEKRLIESALVCADGVCAMGSVVVARGLDASGVDPYERDDVAKLIGIAPALAAEIADLNDNDFCWGEETPEHRWARMRKWAEDQITKTEPEPTP